MSEMLRFLDFPFADGRFPAGLAVCTTRAVSEGRLPPLEVIHAADNQWLIGDGTDPNRPGVALWLHIHHIVMLHPEVAQFATLPLGRAAVREEHDEPWQIESWEYEPD